VTYDARRAHTAVTHPDWTDGHSHNDALRVASKAILRDLWRAARDWHQTPGRVLNRLGPRGVTPAPTGFPAVGAGPELDN
jgi:hypothetical protein